MHYVVAITLITMTAGLSAAAGAALWLGVRCVFGLGVSLRGRKSRVALELSAILGVLTVVGVPSVRGQVIILYRALLLARQPQKCLVAEAGWPI